MFAWETEHKKVPWVEISTIVRRSLFVVNEIPGAFFSIPGAFFSYAGIFIVSRKYFAEPGFLSDHHKIQK